MRVAALRQSPSVRSSINPVVKRTATSVVESLESRQLFAAAPASLDALAGNGRATLTWPAVNGATSYQAYRGTASGQEAATPVATGLGSATFTDTGLTNGSPYFYEVTAVDASGESGKSIEASVTPAVPPTIVTTAAATVSADQTTASLNTLGADASGEENLVYSWSAVALPDNAGEPILSDNGTNAAKSVTATFFAAGDYALTVTATNASGETATNSVDVTVGQTLSSVTVDGGAPTIAASTTRQLTATALDQFGNPMASQPNFTWSIAGTGAVDASGAYTAPAADGSGTITAAITGGSLNGSVTLATMTPAAPTGVVAVPLASTQIEVFWRNNAFNESSFRLERSADGSSGWSTVSGANQIDPATTTYIDTDVSAGETWYYRVFAVNAAGDSDAAGGAGATTPQDSSSTTGATAPTAPTLGLVASSTSAIDITYTNPDGADLELEEMGPHDNNFHTVMLPGLDGDGVAHIQGLTSNTDYSFRLRATFGGFSTYSQTLDASTEDPIATLAAPTLYSVTWDPANHDFHVKYDNVDPDQGTIYPSFYIRPDDVPGAFRAPGVGARLVGRQQ